MVVMALLGVLVVELVVVEGVKVKFLNLQRDALNVPSAPQDYRFAIEHQHSTPTKTDAATEKNSMEIMSNTLRDSIEPVTTEALEKEALTKGMLNSHILVEYAHQVSNPAAQQADYGGVVLAAGSESSRQSQLLQPGQQGPPGPSGPPGRDADPSVISSLQKEVKEVEHQLVRIDELENELYPAWARDADACPDGWHRVGYFSNENRVHCEPPALGDTPGNEKCRFLAKFPQFYDRCGWSKHCKAPWKKYNCYPYVVGTTQPINPTQAPTLSTNEEIRAAITLRNSILANTT